VPDGECRSPRGTRRGFLKISERLRRSKNKSLQNCLRGVIGAKNKHLSSSTITGTVWPRRQAVKKSARLREMIKVVGVIGEGDWTLAK